MVGELSFPFIVRLLTMSDPARAPEPEPDPWINSEAKDLLRQDIEAGRVTAEMKPRAVRQMRPEFRLYKLVNFGNNLRSLRKALSLQHELATFDQNAFENDERLFPPAAANNQQRGYPHWNGSEAKRLLKLDVDANRHDTVTPKALYESRQEYQVYPLAVFRKHIYQEVRSRRDTAYWIHRRERERENN